MNDDDSRLAVLKQGVSLAPDTVFVAIRAGDLRWLLELVDSLREQPNLTLPSPYENN